MKRWTWTGIGSFVTAACIALDSASAQSVTMESVNSSGLWGSYDTSFYCVAREPAISDDGRFVAFVTPARNFLPGDFTLYDDVFVRDRMDGSTACASLGLDGLPSQLGAAEPHISSDGRFVSFYSDDSHLVAGDVQGHTDVFVRDMQTGSTILVSRNSAGAQPSADSTGGGMSGDGRFVSFSTFAMNMVPGDTPFTNDVFLRDTVLQATELLTVDLSGGPGNGDGGNTSLSFDGNIACWQTSASDLVASDTNGKFDIFVRDRAAATTELASVDSAGVQGNGDSWVAVVSGDGRFVAFYSYATNLVAGDTNGDIDIFLRDRTLGTTSRISVDSHGLQSNGWSIHAAISRDGSQIGFTSAATNLVQPDQNGKFDAFVHDRVTGETKCVSRTWTGAEADSHTYGVVLSADGRYAAIWSNASNLIPLDNFVDDVFVVDSAIVCPPTQVYCQSKVDSAGCRPTIGAMGAPLASGFDSFFLVAYQVLPNKSGLVFWGTLPTQIPFGGGSLCVQPPLVRTPVQTSQPDLSPIFCWNQGTYSFHFRQSYMADHGLAAGDTLYAQYWSRDPGFAPPDNVGLSNALQFTICN